jgi:hypothetical protein
MLLFVYGTMKAGGSNHTLLLQQNPIAFSECRTRDRFALYIRRRDKLPIAVRDAASGHPLHGELYDIVDARVVAISTPSKAIPTSIAASRSHSRGSRTRTAGRHGSMSSSGAPRPKIAASSP